MLVESESWQVYQEEPQFFPDIKQTIKPVILYHVVKKIVSVGISAFIVVRP